MIFISFANVIRTQYLIPNEKDKPYIISVVLGAIVNFVLNSILIPKFASIGAAIATIFAEFIVMLYQIIEVRKELNMLKVIKRGIKYIFLGIFMCIIVILVGKLIDETLLSIITQVIVGIIVYMLTAGTLFCKSNNINIKSLICKIIKREDV